MKRAGPTTRATMPPCCSTRMANSRVGRSLSLRRSYMVEPQHSPRERNHREDRDKDTNPERGRHISNHDFAAAGRNGESEKGLAYDFGAKRLPGGFDSPTRPPGDARCDQRRLPCVVA